MILSPEISIIGQEMAVQFSISNQASSPV